MWRGVSVGGGTREIFVEWWGEEVEGLNSRVVGEGEEGAELFEVGVGVGVEGGPLELVDPLGEGVVGEDLSWEM